MPARNLILDSGAFSCWSRGEKIDIDEYIRFCAAHPDCSYYVNLDVIPGRKNDIKSLSLASIEAACEQGWKNYMRMLRVLPIEKVIPVVHQGERIEWLEKYIDFGTPYIGVSPANDRTTDQKARWLLEVRPYIEQSGVKTHGFAVTSFRLMTIFPWWSVDSATWVQMGGMGNVLIPVMRDGSFVFNQKPMTVAVSDRSPRRGDRGDHILSLSPIIRKRVDDYLSKLGLELGEWEVRDVVDGEKPGDNERYYDKTKKQIVKVLKPGIQTDDQRRKWVNQIFYQEANKVLPMDSLYLAGLGINKKIETGMVNRLISYWDCMKSSEARRAFAYHCGELDANESSRIAK